jgi:hypothetical protein
VKNILQILTKRESGGERHLGITDKAICGATSRFALFLVFDFSVKFYFPVSFIFE